MDLRDLWHKQILLFSYEWAIFSRKGREGRKGFWDKGIKGLRDLSAVGRIIPDAPV
jgi:hypothetical protein